MKSIGGGIVLLIVLAVVGFLGLHQAVGVAPAAVAASGGLPAGGPAERARDARQRAEAGVAQAMQAASASRDAAQTR